MSALLHGDDISAALEGLAPAGRLHLLSRVDSTNDYAKTLAREGCPHGTVIMAEEQTAGRGRQGRSFASPKGLGLYATFVLRPGLPPQQLVHVTAMAAVAACRAVARAGGPLPRIKWVNDLILGRKKLGGVLTEFSAEALILGIGLNVLHRAEDFPPELAPTATSLLLESGAPLSRTALARCLTEEIFLLSEHILSRKEDYLRQYKAICLTIGQDILLRRGEEETPAHCTGLDGNGALFVRYADGSEGIVSSGDVSVRGLYGYVDP